MTFHVPGFLLTLDWELRQKWSSLNMMLVFWSFNTGRGRASYSCRINFKESFIWGELPREMFTVSLPGHWFQSKPHVPSEEACFTFLGTSLYFIFTEISVRQDDRPCRIQCTVSQINVVVCTLTSVWFMLGHRGMKCCFRLPQDHPRTLHEPGLSRIVEMLYLDWFGTWDVGSIT